MSRIKQALQRARESGVETADGPRRSGECADPASFARAVPWTMPPGNAEDGRPAGTPWGEGERRRAPRDPAASADALGEVGRVHRFAARRHELPRRPVGEVVRPEVAGRVVVTPGAPLLFVQQYRRLAGNLLPLREHRDVRTLMISSASVGEGKTLTSANLAFTLSESYRSRVLLVDGDVWRAGLGHVFDLPPRPGLADALARPSGEEVLPVALTARLWYLAAGQPAGDDVMPLLNSPAMHALLDDVRQAFDWVLVDMPPVEALPDAGPLAAMFDGVLLVVGARQRPCAALELAVQVIGRERIAGVVLNRAERVGTPARSSYDYYGEGDRSHRDPTLTEPNPR